MNKIVTKMCKIKNMFFLAETVWLILFFKKYLSYGCGHKHFVLNFIDRCLYIKWKYIPMCLDVRNQRLLCKGFWLEAPNCLAVQSLFESMRLPHSACCPFHIAELTCAWFCGDSEKAPLSSSNMHTPSVLGTGRYCCRKKIKKNKTCGW